MLEIIPTILTTSPQELEEILELLDGKTKKVQIDIIDGVFTEGKTPDPSILEHLETGFSLDFHLMVKEPVNWVEKCVRAGAERIIGQVEMMSDQAEFIDQIHEAGALTGLGLDLETPISEIDLSLLNEIEAVLVMSSAVGFGPREFSSQVLEKIKTLARMREEDHLSFQICVDGGITREKVKSLKKAGADQLAIGRRIREGDVTKNIQQFRESVG